MRCPRLEALPAPPPGKTGWPWTFATPQLPSEISAGRPWPRISIVVASLNQGKYIEEMIRSILLQGYPDLEFILIDGGSSDETPAIIRKYEKWLAYSVSEPDHGQSHAFNKGLARITGALFNIFDTDDYFLPGAFAFAGAAHCEHPDRMIAGDVLRTWEGSARTEVYSPDDVDLRRYAQWWNTYHHGQPGLFFPACHLEAVGLINERLNYLFDYEYTLRFLEVTRLYAIRSPLAVIRVHPACKSAMQGDYFAWECVQIARPYQRRFPELEAEANRFAAGCLFGAGCRRLLQGKRDVWRFIREGLRIHPFWALYWVFPGWLFRKLSRRTET